LIAPADEKSKRIMLLKPVGIQKRTVTAILGTALLAFLVFGLGLVLYRDSLVPARVRQFLSPFADSVAIGATPAVEAGDQVRALAILASLKSNPQILRADLLQPDGGTLATYPANQPALGRSLWNRPDGVYPAADTADLMRSFPVSGPRPAHLFIRMSLAAMQQRDRQMLTELSLAVGLILGIVALLQFLLLRRWVLSPLARMVAVADSAGRQGDYSQRMPAHDRDELGQLGRRFNSLLVAVEQREVALRQLASFQRAILNHAAYAIISTDTTGRITSLNPAAEKLLGRRAEELVGQATPEMFHLPEEIAAHARELSVMLGEPVPADFETLVAEARHGRPSEAEWTYVRPDGSRVPVWLSVTALRDERGEIFGFLGLATDISARRQAERHLRETLELNQQLVSASQIGINAFTADGACVLSNAAAARIVGTTVEQMSKMNFRQTASWRKSELLAAADAVLATGESRQIEVHLVTTFGREIWIDCTLSRFYSGGKPLLLHVLNDITARRDVEAELRQQHSLLAGALQATADGILAVSSEGRITSYNRQFAELWRVPPELLDAREARALSEFVVQQLSHPATTPSRFRHFNDASKADTFDLLELADGRVFERFSRPQFLADRVVGRVWSFRDVTARHWAVAALQENEHKFKMLFETANDAILIMNDKAFLDCNRMAEVIYGSPREKIIGQSPIHFSPERQADGQLSAEKAAEKIRAARAGTPQFFEWIHARGDGTLFNAEVSLNRLELRGQTLLQAIVRDVTERRRAETARHEAEELYRTLVNTSPDGITVLDLTGRIQFSSPKALELFYGSPEAESQPGRSAVEFVREADRARALELLNRALTGKFTPNERLVMRRSDGLEFVAELNGTLLRDGLGVPRGVMVIIRDVTERQRQEDELKNKNSELERFTYTVSHDLKSPLITIKGFAGALLADAAAGRTDRLTDDLKRIVLAADKMAELLNGLLELSRIGRILNPPQNVSMSRLAEDVLALLAGTIAQRQARVTVQPGLPDAYGDAQRLQEVLQNLVENALKFSAPGRAPEIEIGFATIGEPTAYFVRDRGRGIEARFHESIFGLFNKLDTRSEGTGIGLALVRRIVEFHGGSIWVESAGLGEGATFYFTLAGRKALSAPLVS
jgi:PAS domain S-box-containing protein